MHQWKGLHEYYTMETQKFDFFSKKFEIRILTFDKELKNLVLFAYHTSVSAVVFCKQFLAYIFCAHWWVCLLSIKYQSCFNVKKVDALKQKKKKNWQSRRTRDTENRALTFRETLGEPVCLALGDEYIYFIYLFIYFGRWNSCFHE